MHTLREKCSYSEFFWSAFFRIRTRKTPNEDSSYAAILTNAAILVKDKANKNSTFPLPTFHSIEREVNLDEGSTVADEETITLSQVMNVEATPGLETIQPDSESIVSSDGEQAADADESSTSTDEGDYMCWFNRL